VRIALLASGNRLLSSFGTWAYKKSRIVLDRLLVSIYFDTRVERVEEQALYVSGDCVLRAATMVWTAEVRAPSFLSMSGLLTDDLGRITCV